MGRAPCCSKVGLQRGPWTSAEDASLTSYIQAHGEGHWRSLPKNAGLLRCGKSCRLRWMNYLRPGIKRGNISSDEEDVIIRMHSLLGNRWSLIAGRLPGRTDNEIKNYWNTHLAKRLSTTTQARRAHQKKSSKEKKRKKNNNTNKTSKKSHNHKNNKEGILIVQEKPKIHLPKAVRLTGASRISNNLPRNDSFGSNTASCDHFINGGGGYDIKNVGVSFLFGDDHDDDDVEPTSNKVQKVYDEYLKILERDHHDDDQLDSFTQ